MLFRSKRETEQIKILLLSFRMRRLGDDDCSIFDMPAQNHLCRGNLVRSCDTFDRAISSVQISAASHRRIRFHCNAVRLAVFHNLALLPGRVQFDLVDGRILARLLMQAVKMFGHEIAHAQCAHAVFRTKLLECLPRFAGTPVERSRPMEHIHVDIVEL